MAQNHKIKWMKKAATIFICIALIGCDKEDDPIIEDSPPDISSFVCNGIDRDADIITGKWYFHYNQSLEFYGCCVVWSYEYKSDSVLIRRFDTEDGVGDSDTLKWYWKDSDSHHVTILIPDAGGVLNESTFPYVCITKDTVFIQEELTTNESFVTHTNPY